MEEMQEKLDEERKITEQFKAMVLMLLQDRKEKEDSLQKLLNRV